MFSLVDLLCGARMDCKFDLAAATLLQQIVQLYLNCSVFTALGELGGESERQGRQGKALQSSERPKLALNFSPHASGSCSSTKPVISPQCLPDCQTVASASPKAQANSWIIENEGEVLVAIAMRRIGLNLSGQPSREFPGIRPRMA